MPRRSESVTSPPVLDGSVKSGAGLPSLILDPSRSAERLPRHKRDGRRPIQVPQPMSDVEAGIDQPARAVDFHDHQIRLIRLRLVQLTIQELLQQRRNGPLEANQDRPFVLGTRGRR